MMRVPRCGLQVAMRLYLIHVILSCLTGSAAGISLSQPLRFEPVHGHSQSDVHLTDQFHDATKQRTKFQREVPGKGYELLFTSNRNTWTNYSLQFDKELPGWLSGVHFQIGPALFEMEKRKVRHAFDGFGKLNMVSFVNGRAWFSNKFINSEFYQKSKGTGTIAPFLLFEEPEPPFSVMENLLGYYRGLDNMNVNVKQIADQLVTLTDIWQLYAINETTLETMEKVSPTVPVGPLDHYPFPLPSSCHPVKEVGSTSEISFVSLLDPVPFSKSSINVIRMKSVSDRQLIASIERDWNTLPYMHSLALSPNYAVIFAHPVFLRAFKSVLLGNLLDVLQWEPTVPTDVYVVRLKDGKITKLQTDAHFFVHHVNSYESGDVITVDYTVYEDPGLFYGLDIATQLNSTSRDALNITGSIKRIVIDVKSETIAVTDFEQTPGAEPANSLDMPKVSDRVAHKKHCYVYGVSMKADGRHFADSALAKKDVCTKNRDRVWKRLNHYPSEPFFVARPGGTEEDDGLLMSIILDGERQRSYVGVFDPKTMQLINRGSLPDALPLLLHGTFIP